MAKILVVDDELEILSLLETFLKAKGFDAVTTDSGEKALEMITQDESLDLIILDVRMPRVSGADILNAMKEKGIKTPVIILTGSLGEETKRLVANDYLMKPVDLKELYNKVNEWVKKGT